jgi:hypothetical protein
MNSSSSSNYLVDYNNYVYNAVKGEIDNLNMKLENREKNLIYANGNLNMKDLKD